MPYLKNYRLLVSHSWTYSSQYDTIVSWLNSTSYFQWSNHSISCNNPLDTTTKSELKQKLTNKISGCHAIIAVSGMYASYSEWIDYEIDEAIRMGKPIIGIRPWGSERTPSKISQNSTVMVGWNSSSLVTAVRNYAL